MLQVAINALAVIITGKSVWQQMLASQFLSWGALLFYVLIGLVVLSFVYMVRSNKSAARMPGPSLHYEIEAAAPEHEAEPAIPERGLEAALAEARDLRGERYRPLAPSGTFQVIQAGPQDPEPINPDIKWKRKFMVILRSRAVSQAEVHAPDWICSNGYIPFQPHPSFWSILRAENTAAGGWMSDKWQNEVQMLTVSPNAVFQASVGLDHTFSIENFKSRSGTRRVGMLVLPVTIDGREMEWRVRL